jgi:hypothetical protein
MKKIPSVVIAALSRNLLPIAARLSMKVQMLWAVIILSMVFLFSSRTLLGEGELLPSGSYLRPYADEGIFPSETPVSVPDSRKELLFVPGPPPSQGDVNNAPPVGGAPVPNCYWVLILCCIGYGVYARKKSNDQVNRVIM